MTDTMLDAGEETGFEKDAILAHKIFTVWWSWSRKQATLMHISTKNIWAPSLCQVLCHRDEFGNMDFL